MNKLFFGDNLDILREHIKDETIDLVYLDPPFNSKRDYSVLFKTPKGHESDAQITAFEDSWHWGQQAENEFEELLRQPNTDVAEMMRALRNFLGENDMMAYLTMMANRLLELHRVLKPTGSLYLHCDPTASHYLKIVLDGVFGKELFRGEIVWQRTGTHNDAKRWPFVADNIFYYTKSREATWNPQFSDQSPEDIATRYRFKDEKGRRFRLGPIDSPNPRPNLMYEWKGYSHPAKGWRYSKESMAKLDEQGLIYYPADKTKRLARKLYLEESKGALIGNVWTDIGPLQYSALERLGYQTQKPLALLERIISASSNAGDVVLDPFCGCGTAVHAAHKLNRKWIGIDITHLAISLIEKRLRDAFPKIEFEVEGTPEDAGGAADLAARDKYQFQWWACSLVNAQPYQGKKKGSDGGIDGLIFFQDTKKDSKKIIVSVKGGESVGVTMVKDLIATVQREQAAIGLFVTLTKPTKPMIAEAASAGFYDSPLGMSFPKIQILTIEGLMDGSERAEYPDLTRGGLTFKRAQKEKIKANQSNLF